MIEIPDSRGDDFAVDATRRSAALLGAVARDDALAAAAVINEILIGIEETPETAGKQLAGHLYAMAQMAIQLSRMPPARVAAEVEQALLGLMHAAPERDATAG